MSDVPNDATIRQLGDVMWRASRTAQVIAGNIGNVDTPGCRALQVDFQGELRRLGAIELEQTDPRHLTLGGETDPTRHAFVSEAPWERMRTDGNTVDIDREMTRLSRVQGRMRTAAQLIRKRFGLMRYAATDGRI